MQSTSDYKLVLVFPYNSEIAICLNSISRENHEQILVLRNFIHKFGRYAALKILKSDGYHNSRKKIVWNFIHFSASFGSMPLLSC